jgi:glycosyltransferase involved in cell wall biosynthesis
MFDLRSASGAAPGEVLFFLPAGFRTVKRNAFALGPLAALRARGVPLRFVAAGPVLSPAAAEDFDRGILSHPWARRFPAFPPEVRATVLSRADVVLNTSAHEGMSNAVLEAMLAGRAVLASDIPGNRAAIRDGETGLLFSGEEDFAAKAERLARDAGLRASLGGAARADALVRFAPEREAKAVHAAYLEVLAERGRGGLP